MSRLINKLRYEIEKSQIRFNQFVYRVAAAPVVYDIDSTLDTILERKASISRYGDGEFDIIFGRSQPFQPFNKVLRERLRTVLTSNDISDRFLVGIPDCYGDLSHFIPEAQQHWKIRLDKERFKWYGILNRNHPYYQAQITRFYHDWADKSRCEIWAEKLKRIWYGRDVLIVEGEKSRLGVSNDLFTFSNSVRRILCPAVDAFSKYDSIIEAVTSHANKNDLVLLALGPTASVMAYDLFIDGYQAIDIGHIDLEYEWMKMHASTKVRIPGRFMNELDGGAYVDDSVIDSTYKGQIVCTIL
jgi:glycosyltransferase family protein